MSFKGIRNTNGRPKGSLNKLNSEVKETIVNIIEGNAEGFKERLERLNDSDFIKYYLQLLKFVIPYQKPIDIPHIKNEFPFQKVEVEIIEKKIN